MNFKRNLLVISALVGTVFAVAGCVDKKAFVPYTFIPEVIDSYQDEVFCGGAATRLSEYAPYYAKGISESAYEEPPYVNIGSFYDVMTERSRKKIIPAEGEQKILVIPVEFSDYRIEDRTCSTKEYVKNLQKAFFGTSSNNNYVSVSQYYNVSSYGKLRITGKVSEYVYEYPESVTTILTRGGNSNDIRDQIWTYYDKIIEDYSRHYDDIDEFKLHPGEDVDYDVPLYLVYNYPADALTNKNNFFWNFTFPEKCLSWSSYHSLNIINDKPDAHTFIHEVGHLFGLVDYYPTEIQSDSDVIIEPVGCIDMMDSSVGDHTAFSKMQLNWLRPIHITNSCEITISALANKGDVILLNDNWNGSVFDEYYLLEFYSPTGLNTFDVVYGNDKVKLPQMPGIKVYHVDATLGYYDRENASIRNKYVLKGFCETGGFDPLKTKIDFVRDNTNYKKVVGNETTDNYLYELVYNVYDAAIPEVASDEHLFHLGDSFSKFRMNGQRFANYRVTITNLNYREVTLKFEKTN